MFNKSIYQTPIDRNYFLDYLQETYPDLYEVVLEAEEELKDIPYELSAYVYNEYLTSKIYYKTNGLVLYDRRRMILKVFSNGDEGRDNDMTNKLNPNDACLV